MGPSAPPLGPSRSWLSSVLLAPPADKLTRDAAIAIMHAARSRSFEMLVGSKATSEIGRLRLFKIRTPVGFELGPFLGREVKPAWPIGYLGPDPLDEPGAPRAVLSTPPITFLVTSSNYRHRKSAWLQQGVTKRFASGLKCFGKEP